MKNPTISSECFIAEGAIVKGDVTIEKDASVWFHVTIRAEETPITIKEGTNIQDNCVLHIDENCPVFIEELVSVGHGAIIHGCSIGKHSLIGMGAVILNGAKIGRECIIGAGALIPQNSIIPDNSLVVGVPGKIIRSTTEEEVEENIRNAKKYITEARTYSALLTD